MKIGTEATVTFDSIADNDETEDVDESVKTVVGADIRKNVFGGGRGENAKVTGNTNVEIGQ